MLFHHDDPCGWDSITVKLEYLGRSSKVRRKFTRKPVGICLGRWKIPEQWQKGDMYSVGYQKEQLEQVMKKYGFRRADPGEGKFEFLKVMVGLDVLIDHIDD